MPQSAELRLASGFLRSPLLQVLRFFAQWEDADSLQGETRPVTIQYFLVDDTVEIRMVHQPNSGRDPCPVLMRRQMLPKKVKPGESACVCCLSLYLNILYPMKCFGQESFHPFAYIERSQELYLSRGRGTSACLVGVITNL